MPIRMEQFKSEGSKPKHEFVQENIIRILEANPEKAFSAIELENALDTRRQSIHQALRALEAKGKVKRGFIEQNRRQVVYVRLTTEEERNGTILEKPAKTEKPKKKGKGRKKKKKGK